MKKSFDEISTHSGCSKGQQYILSLLKSGISIDNEKLLFTLYLVDSAKRKEALKEELRGKANKSRRGSFAPSNRRRYFKEHIAWIRENLDFSTMPTTDS